MARDNLAHGYGTYVHQNGTVYQGLPLRCPGAWTRVFFSERHRRFGGYGKVWVATILIMLYYILIYEYNS